MNEKEKVKGKRKPILYALSFLILALCMLFSSLTTNIVSVSADATTIRDRYFSTFSNDLSENTTDYYYDKLLQNTASNGNLKNDYYSWTAGASVKKDNVNQLVFRLELNNPSAEILDTDNYFFFRVYKCSKDNVSAEQILTLFVKYDFENYSSNIADGYYLNRAVGIKQHVYGEEKISFSNHEKNVLSDEQHEDLENYNTIEETNYVMATQEITRSGYDIISYTRQKVVLGEQNTQLDFYGNPYKYTYLTIDTPDANARYFVRFTYNYGCTSTPSDEQGGSYIDELGAIDTKITSLYDVLYKVHCYDTLNGFANADMVNKATDIVYNGSVEEVEISYLEQIGTSPFALKKYAIVEVPVVNGVIRPTDVAKLLGLSSLNVMQSPCQYLVEDETTGIYNAVYLESVWLSAKDSNGHNENYFLEINRSYRDYYHGLVDNGVISQAMYNWFWSQMINDFPEIAPFMDYELYGYFGYVTIPNIYSLNSLWNTLFDGSPNFSGVINYFMYEEYLSLSAYNVLLEEYHYNWLGKAWNDFASFFDDGGASANNYLFYVGSEYTDAFIGENGAEDIYDNGGALGNGVEETVENIVDAFKKFFDFEWSKYVAYFFGIIGILIIVSLFMSLIRGFTKTKTAIEENKLIKQRRKRKRIKH